MSRDNYTYDEMRAMLIKRDKATYQRANFLSIMYDVFMDSRTKRVFTRPSEFAKQKTVYKVDFKARRLIGKADLPDEGSLTPAAKLLLKE